MKRCFCIISVAILLVIMGGRSIAEETAAGLSIQTEGQALSFMEDFFASPYVDNPNDNPLFQTVQTESTESGWILSFEALDASQTVTLAFDRAGKVAYYSDSSFLLPSLDGVDFSQTAPGELPNGDQLCRELDKALWQAPGIAFIPDSICAYAYDGEHHAYTFSYNNFERYATFEIAPETKLLAYGNMQLDDARYGLYLSRGEAIAKARTAFVERLDITAEEAAVLIVSQMDFVTWQNQWSWTDEPHTLPYWHILFTTAENGYNGEYGALIDGDTGMVLEMHDPSTYQGQG